MGGKTNLKTSLIMAVILVGMGLVANTNVCKSDIIYTVVDDMEDYNDRDDIREVWTDGYATVDWGTPPSVPPVTGGSSGSNLNTSTAVGSPLQGNTGPIHDGKQAMVLRYDNDGFTYTGLPGDEEWVYDAPYYSEIEANTVGINSLDVGQTWDSEGVKSLSLWFQGHPVSDGFHDTRAWPVYTIYGRGRDIWGRHDEFYFLNQYPFIGQGSVQTQVLSVDNTDPWAKAGVMIRDKWTPYAKYAAVFITPGQGVTFQWRELEGGESQSLTKPGITAPQYVRLVRNSNGTFQGYHSTTTSGWQDVNVPGQTPFAPTITMNSAGVYVGTAVSSHNADEICSAEFDDLLVGPNPTNWAFGNIGLNDPEQLYVALSDGVITAVVEHTDVNAATLTTWQEWNIPLTAFTGVDFNSIKKVYIGLGDRNTHPDPGGSGAVYIDDIRLYKGVPLFVDAGAPAGGNGSSWANAYKYLQDALAAASSGDEIRVAEGTYRPDQVAGVTFNDRTATFQLINGVAIYGGYAGFGEPDTDHRDIVIYETILSGDIGIIGDSNDNSYHVVTGSGTDATAILDGFTITGGNADGGGSIGNGGGMFNYNGSPMVTNCTFTGNMALTVGGGMHNTGASSPTLTNCTFNGNTSTYGAGIHNNFSSRPTITNCAFSGNTATTDGGGMYNTNSSNPTLTNCTFTGNTASEKGGAIFSYDGSPTVTNCILWGDTPDEFYDIGDEPTVTYSDVEGGYSGTGNIDADPCFVDAAANDLRLLSDSPCVDTGNTSAVPLDTTDLDGDGDTSEPIPFDLNGDPRVWNDVVDIGALEYVELRVHNVTQNSYYITIQRAIDDANDYDKIEVAPGAYNEAIDFNGKSVRVYSSGGPDVTTIDANGIAGAYHVVQCVSGEGANTILEGFTITGGDANGPVSHDQRGGGMYNYQSSPTVTDCNFTANTANFGGGIFNLEANNVSLTRCTFSFNSAVIQTGGLHIHSCSDAIVTDCSFISNTSPEGGAMHNAYSSPTVTNCIFTGNGSDVGGGMYNRNGSSPTVTNCIFTGNGSDVGGGMYNRNGSSPTVTDCNFTGNTAVNHGGGMFNENNSSPTVTNCTFSGNDANNGGGMYDSNSSPMVTNCTFSGNSAAEFGGGILNNVSSSPTVTNCILWGNEPNEIDNDATSSAAVVFSDVQGGWPDANNTNIDADPLFVDANNPDPNLCNLRLKLDSPCIDAGDSTVVLAMSVAYDVDGKDRYVDIDTIDDTGSGLFEFLDMGAYEFDCSGIDGDNNCDGVVDFKDLAILCGNWLAGVGD